MKYLTGWGGNVMTEPRHNAGDMVHHDSPDSWKCDWCDEYHTGEPVRAAGDSKRKEYLFCEYGSNKFGTSI